MYQPFPLIATKRSASDLLPKTAYFIPTKDELGNWYKLIKSTNTIKVCMCCLTKGGSLVLLSTLSQRLCTYPRFWQEKGEDPPPHTDHFWTFWDGLIRRKQLFSHPKNVLYEGGQIDFFVSFRNRTDRIYSWKGVHLLWNLRIFSFWIDRRGGVLIFFNPKQKLSPPYLLFWIFFKA